MGEITVTEYDSLQELIDAEAEKIKAELRGDNEDLPYPIKSTLFGEPVNFDDPNSLIVAAYYLAEQKANERQMQMLEMFDLFRRGVVK